ncbi:Oidioi.mRNA.OKI2018_I69.XSR.g16225.t1.cds [Oikopleura dioica]|uniref:Oidioi.mRNA.OKI2018_I69.XSR.g16225.t1.cds n=1 Tax=Oikopleura dioica TaxID=34765 RepID=A0ABN7SMR7_OIKDI|nr:Oidioi.mRNA.OKI2018_I69.XSR.g16225.t1.cds [Oikopleura dioica]
MLKKRLALEAKPAWVTAVDGGPRRVNHASAAIGERVYLFGGYCSLDSTPYSDQATRSVSTIDVFCLDSKTMRWKKLRDKDGSDKVKNIVDRNSFKDTPYMRYGHAVTPYKDKVYLWGGRNDQYGPDADMFCYCTMKNSWEKVEWSGNRPFGRDGHTMNTWNDKIIIFGGFDAEYDTYSNDTHIFDIKEKSWSRVVTSGSAPRWRDFHTAVIIRDRLFIFGGRCDVFGTQQSARDYYDPSVKYLDLKSLKWSNQLDKVAPDAEQPIGRRSHAAFAYNEKMFIFGGYNQREKNHFNDLWCFDPETCIWYPIFPSGKNPSPRRRHTASCIGSKVLISGGTAPVEDRSRWLSDPVESEDEEIALKDLAETVLLDFDPTLKTFCLMEVMKNLAMLNSLDAPQLPKTLINELSDLTEDNEISCKRTNGERPRKKKNARPVLSYRIKDVPRSKG